MNKPVQVTCPACRQPALFAPANPWRPFCSQRCRHNDLGAWASESYRVAGEPVDENGQRREPPAEVH